MVNDGRQVSTSDRLAIIGIAVTCFGFSVTLALIQSSAPWLPVVVVLFMVAGLGACAVAITGRVPTPVLVVNRDIRIWRANKRGDRWTALALGYLPYEDSEGRRENTVTLMLFAPRRVDPFYKDLNDLQPTITPPLGVTCVVMGPDTSTSFEWPSAFDGRHGTIRLAFPQNFRDEPAKDGAYLVCWQIATGETVTARFNVKNGQFAFSLLQRLKAKWGRFRSHYRDPTI